ncbi:glycosyltransferase family 4 protein [Shinella sumterensis]|uniref:Glycosyltransferase family 4 protein n=1 Tax=Shinella sumterensis TaxID=1967501 RepID=A0AA50H6Y1_9HYPH|nr:glycosyltransferase family 4 protein [Shinella sumterensis]WLR96199.1 glycosyltransferase family 4 protein [Shinella sumterensis]
MRVLLLSQYFYPEQFSNNEIARELVRRGHKVSVVCCVPNYPSGAFTRGYSNSERRIELWEGVSIYRTRTIPRGKSALQLIANYAFFPFAASWTAIRRLKHKPDVSFVSMPSPLLQALAGIFLKWWWKTPCVYWVQDIWPESVTYTLRINNRFVRRMLEWLCGWIYRQADHIFVQSDAFPDMITRFGVPRDRIKTLPNTAPPTYRPIRPEEVSGAAQRVSGSGFRLMFAGNIGESQDFDTIIEAAQILNGQVDMTWIIIGSGRDEVRVREKIKSLGLEHCFNFMGRFPEEEMPSFFAIADALLVSLKSIPIFSLTVPYKVQCYLACGKPIIAALDGEGKRIVEEAGAGLTASASNPSELANAIKLMIDMSPENRTTLGQSGLAYFEANYAREIVYDILETELRTQAKTI